MNPFVYSTANKRYHTFDYYLKHKYGQKVFKVALDGGFSCPNRDGKCGTGGCIFCSNSGSGEYAGNRKDNLLKQFEDGYQKMLKKWPNGKAIAYFQAFTNTYAPVSYLKQCFEPFVNHENVVGLAIATRPDCLEDDVLDYLEDINQRTDLYLELGLQTIYDETARFFNRGYPYKTFLKAIQELHRRGIKVVVHLINGLPNESKEMMMETVKEMARLPLFGIKFHYLSVLKDTALEKLYNEGKIKVLTKEEHLSLVAEQLTHLPPSFVIQRIGTDAMKSELIAPKWNSKKVTVSNDLDKLMLKNDWYQGLNYQKDASAISYAHLLASFPKNKKIAVDATLGNGHDSFKLLFNYQEVYGFDIQELAIKRSKKRLENFDNMHIIHDSFVNIIKYVDQPIDCLMYNLGFLPGSDRKIRTEASEVIKSLDLTLPHLSPNGSAIIVFYPRHNNGEEYLKVSEYLKTKDYHCIYTQIDNEIVLEITKK